MFDFPDSKVPGSRFTVCVRQTVDDYVTYILYKFQIFSSQIEISFHFVNILRKILHNIFLIFLQIIFSRIFCWPPYYLFYLPLFQITPERNVQIVLKGKPLAFRETQYKVPLKGQYSTKCCGLGHFKTQILDPIILAQQICPNLKRL